MLQNFIFHKVKIEMLSLQVCILYSYNYLITQLIHFFIRLANQCILSFVKDKKVAANVFDPDHTLAFVLNYLYVYPPFGNP